VTPITIALFVVVVMFRTEIGPKLAICYIALWFVVLILVMVISGLPIEKLVDRPWAVENERWAMARWGLLGWEIFLLGCAWCTKEYRERT
jgi:hypothetical protein